MLSTSYSMPFITPKTNTWQLPDNIQQSWCTFNPAKYTDDLYPLLEVPFPKSLKNAVDKRKAEHLAGRYCAHKALYELRREKYSVIRIGLHGSPQWPPGINGSISHSQTWACSFVSSDPAIKGVGVDIESVVDSEMVEQSKDLILLPEELPLLELESIDMKHAFTLIFSLKESFFKAAFPIVRKYLDFDVLAVTRIDPENQRIDFLLKEDLPSHLQAGTTFEAKYCWLEPSLLATSFVLTNGFFQKQPE